MKPLGLILILILVSATYGVSATQNEDDFSEFDDFDEDPVAHKDDFIHEHPGKKVEINVEDAEADASGLETA